MFMKNAYTRKDWKDNSLYQLKDAIPALSRETRRPHTLDFRSVYSRTRLENYSYTNVTSDNTLFKCRSTTRQLFTVRPL
jgi:hypothetical protein